MIALDTNLLVYAHRAATPQHRAARTAIARASRVPDGWGLPAPVVAEFWSVVTHPAASGRPSTPEEALAFLTHLHAAGAQAWPTGPGFGLRLAQLAADLQVGGNRIFDVQIALCAFEGGATELWSHDRAFITVPGLRLVDPLSSSTRSLGPTS